MFSFSNRLLIGSGLAMVLLVSSCGFKRKKYENPITKDTQQPDKVLFDKAISDIEHGRYEVARLTLNTLINTYDTSEYLAKAKLAVADSWYREGGLHGMAQAEAEYKDFILFYPTMEEASESQQRICDIHYREMQKPDRDPNDALRAEQECKQLLVQFPNSKYAPQAMQRLREIQEDLGESEMLVGDFYHHKGSWAAAANRLSGLSDQYPLYSRADQALWEEGDAYGHMGARFRPKQGEAYTRLVRDYPLSPYADQAKKKLRDLELPVPEADPAALEHMKYEAENRTKASLVKRSTRFLSGSPDLSMAAKSGTPQMNNPKQNVPVSVPVPADATGGVNDVTVAPVTGASALDTQPDARSQAADGSAKPADATAAAASSTTQDTGKKKKGKKNKQAPAPAATTPATDAATPATPPPANQ
jgi:outer membrane protein assembly factor BamD